MPLLAQILSHWDAWTTGPWWNTLATSSGAVAATGSGLPGRTFPGSLLGDVTARRAGPDLDDEQLLHGVLVQVPVGI
jgi:hypothetical protein